MMPSSAAGQCRLSVPPVGAVSAAYQCPSFPAYQCIPSVLPISAASPTHIKEEILPV
ncbi:unnamed protein product, partial [Staurois parvus]